MSNFLDFIREQGVVGLAIGFILGGAVSSVVASFNKDIINPLLSLILGSTEALAQQAFMVGEISIAYGNFITALINFVIIAAVVYFGFKGLGLDKLDKKKTA